MEGQTHLLPRANAGFAYDVTLPEPSGSNGHGTPGPALPSVVTINKGLLGLEATATLGPGLDGGQGVV